MNFEELKHRVQELTANTTGKPSQFYLTIPPHLRDIVPHAYQFPFTTLFNGTKLELIYKPYYHLGVFMQDVLDQLQVSDWINQNTEFIVVHRDQLDTAMVTFNRNERMLFQFTQFFSSDTYEMIWISANKEHNILFLIYD